MVGPIYQTTIFSLDDQSYSDIRATGGLHETWYSRFRNPTVDEAAAAIADLEHGAAGLMTSSGMAAIATTLVTLLRSGDRVIAAKELYGDTRDLLVRDLASFGVEVDLVDATDAGAWRAAVARKPPQVIYAETLSNPQLRLLDIPFLAELARESRATLVVDNTFATPYAVQPLAHGAHVVINSVTKYLNGHSDVTAGCVVADAVTIERCQQRLITFGGCLDPLAAFLILRGLKTFELRLARQTASAGRVAEFLEKRTDVARVFYPGLASYPQAELARRMLKGNRCGAMVTFVVKGGDERAGLVMRRLERVAEATSLGGVESLVSSPPTSSQFNLSRSELDEVGIVPGMLRLSVGVEDGDQLIDDLRQALDDTSVQD
ncbi:MAG TPA: aminotransferase class I/II-fold pyridoxal phosphate-dependent enzyme [Candidatus Dormibacteraeota bacterium]|nr:aminotransferase class I/II-fold pyridoxal phosphate-dependent enzyme [Candidatus Dormibacteraeota bacterium]